MAKKRKSMRSSDGVEVDLTPMIDVTFQLIIFFMVVSQITSQENVNLRLPDALAANEPDPKEKKLFTVHIAPINQSGDVAMPDEFGWFCYGDANPRSIDEMRGILTKEAAIVDPDRDLLGIGPDGISENMVVVRCDARAPASNFGKLIELMASLMMYKIKIAILKDQRLD
ncbi:MAG: biopolymer transporter ExbD [Planctomycetes bacterium]|nr:biopolymer transporter ExbD [Planctomycetota bacterium]